MARPEVGLAWYILYYTYYLPRDLVGMLRTSVRYGTVRYGTDTELPLPAAPCGERWDVWRYPPVL